MSEPTIRRIAPGNGAKLRTIRLRALSTDPTAFGSTYAEEKDRPDDAWDVWAAATSSGNDQAMFVAEVEDEFVGMAGAYRPDGSPRTLHVIAMWVAPDHRRSGIATRLTDAMVRWASRADADELTLWVVDGNDDARRLYGAAGFEETGTTQPLPSHPELTERLMRRPLDASVPRLPSGYVEFQPMSAVEFDSFLTWTLSDHTAAIMQAFGTTLADARSLAATEMEKVLPHGLATPEQHLCSIRAGVADAAVGWIWFGRGSVDGVPAVMLYDIVVFERWRRRGIGSAAIDEVEEWARAQGYTTVGLEVFTHNHEARRLYRALGYDEHRIEQGYLVMTKQMTAGDPPPPHRD